MARISTAPRASGAASSRPSGLSASGPAETFRTVLTSAPLAVLQTRKLRSSPAVNTSLPSGLNVALVTFVGWRRTCRTRPPLVRIRAVRSSPAVSTRRSSGLKDAAQTGPRSTASTRSSGAVPGSQMRAVPSALAVAIALPSGPEGPFGDGIGVPAKDGLEPAGRRLPDTSRSVGARGDDELAVLAEGSAVDGVDMSEDRHDTLSRPGVPDACRPVGARRHDQLPVWD